MATLASDRRGIAIRSLIVAGVVLTLAGVGGAVGALVLRKPSSYSRVASGLEPSADHLDFGEVWEDTQFACVLPITNHGG